MRLQKYMAHCGVASRRKCEEMIKQGRVTVNGQVVTQLGVKVDPQKDEVRVDGKAISLEQKQVYILLYKPRGYVTTVKDTHGRPTVVSLVGNQPARVYPVGRLDFDTEGVLLLTNDGELANKLMHPRYGVEKEYYAVVDGRPSKSQIQAFIDGIDIGDAIAHAHKVRLLWQKGNSSAFKVVLKEGRNRQIRRMFEAIGCPVKFLRRERLGNLVLGDLKPGQWRYLDEGEVMQLKKLTEAET
ncbi:MAG: pseudouridine synthase [Caldicoprobacter oshimai]